MPNVASRQGRPVCSVASVGTPPGAVRLWGVVGLVGNHGFGGHFVALWRVDVFDGKIFDHDGFFVSTSTQRTSYCSALVLLRNLISL